MSRRLVAANPLVMNRSSATASIRLRVSVRRRSTRTGLFSLMMITIRSASNLIWWNSIPTKEAPRMSTAISTAALTKSFGQTRALDGLDLQVNTGEVHGFLGPNGAGKTTTLRILLGLLRADSGRAELLGGDPWGDAVSLHRRLAFVPGDVELWPNLTGGEVIDLFARLRGGHNKARRDELIERFDLDPTKKGRTYSKGNRQKVALIAALASDVELLLLDEPTAGLDPLMEAVFQDCIREARETG